MAKRGRKRSREAVEDLETALQMLNGGGVNLDPLEYDYLAGLVAVQLSRIYNGLRVRQDVSKFWAETVPHWSNDFAVTAYFMEWYSTLSGCDGLSGQTSDRHLKLLAVQALDAETNELRFLLQGAWLAEPSPPAFIYHALSWACRSDERVLLGPECQGGVSHAAAGTLVESDDPRRSVLSVHNDSIAQAQEYLLDLYQLPIARRPGRKYGDDSRPRRIAGLSAKTKQVLYAGSAEQQDFEASLLVGSTANIVGAYACRYSGKTYSEAAKMWDVLVADRIVEALEQVPAGAIPKSFLFPTGRTVKFLGMDHSEAVRAKKSSEEFRVVLSRAYGVKVAGDLDSLVTLCAYLRLRTKAGGYAGEHGGVLRMCCRAQYSVGYLGVSQLWWGRPRVTECPAPFFVWKPAAKGMQRGQNRPKYCPLCRTPGLSGSHRCMLSKVRERGQFPSPETGEPEIHVSNLPGHGEPSRTLRGIPRLISCQSNRPNNASQVKTSAATTAVAFSQGSLATSFVPREAKKSQSSPTASSRSRVPSQAAAG